MIYDLIIIGGGPAGVAAGIYAARKWLKTILITDEFGGQSAVSEDIQNWIGTISIHGKKLAENLKKHLLAYAEDVVDIVENEKVETLTQAQNIFIAVFRIYIDHKFHHSLFYISQCFPSGRSFYKSL